MAKVIYEPCYECSGVGVVTREGDHPHDPNAQDVTCPECGGGAVYATCPECKDNITGYGTVIAGDLARVQAQLAAWPGDYNAQVWVREYQHVEEHGVCRKCRIEREDEEHAARKAAAVAASVRIVECESRTHCLACERTIEPRAKMLAWPTQPRLAFCDECRQNIARAVAS